MISHNNLFHVINKYHQVLSMQRNIAIILNYNLLQLYLQCVIRYRLIIVLTPFIDIIKSKIIISFVTVMNQKLFNIAKKLNLITFLQMLNLVQLFCCTIFYS